MFNRRVTAYPFTGILQRSFLVLSMSMITQTFSVLAANKASDPTRPGNFVNVTSDTQSNQDRLISVNAIMKKGLRYIAIINGESVSSGDTINKWVVKNIDTSSVYLQLKDEPNSPAIKFRVSKPVNVKKRVTDNE